MVSLSLLYVGHHMYHYTYRRHVCTIHDYAFPFESRGRSLSVTPPLVGWHRHSYIKTRIKFFDTFINMKLKCTVLLLATTLFVAVLGQNKYSTRYDNVNVDMILSNQRVLNNYIKCMMDEGPCTAEGRELKSKYILKFYFIIFFTIQE